MALLLGMPLSSRANSVVKISKVSSPVTVTGSTDYTILSASPFTDDGVVDITDTDHSVVILQAVKPSAALKLLSHVKINGTEAKNGTNCQVKLYNRGCIILPYGDSAQPLTVYSEPNFGGTAVSDFGLEHNGGYMNNLSEAKLNNQIQSFKLKRGYMVTFATKRSGYGYSRCFIAADGDLEVAILPAVLNKTISAYRIFKWYDTGKPQLANADGNYAACSALNVTSTYNWGVGSDMSPDFECVPQHAHEGWPNIDDLGKATFSPHMKTNNEPRNPADDSPNTLDQILANWERLMATGRRLCTPSSWDGSDYVSNASGFLAQFLDSIDARGWRCDVIDLHCYWPEGSFGAIHNWVDKFHRPVWISEWVWGASWNNNGAFASGVTETQNADALKRICPQLNGYDYVERYYYWNNERDPSRLYKDGKLTEAGRYYATLDGGLAYNGKYDYAPKTPRQYDPINFKATYADGKAVITWRDRNGEHNQLMEVQRKRQGGQWQVIATIDQQEYPANYTYTDDQAQADDQYRIHLKDIDGRDRYTNAAIEVGDVIETSDGKRLYAGGNMIVNGDFNLGLTGWTSGKGAEASQPHFQVVAKGGIDGGNYLQCYNNAGRDDAGSLKTVFQLTPGSYYMFRLATINGSTWDKLSLSSDGQEESQVVLELAASAGWERQTVTFNSGDYSQLLMAYRWLNNVQIDEVQLRRLYDTYEEATLDGRQQEQRLAEAIEAYAKEHPDNAAELRKAEYDAARQAIGLSADTEIDYSKANVQPQSADFSATTGWQTKVGTYTGGDQRTNTVGGKTCWNAWWSGLNAGTGLKNTMEIRQQLTDLEEGIYAMQCKATTEHYCLSDQHGYIVSQGDTARTEPLAYDYFDLTSIGNIWQTLTTLPLYVADGGTATIGFKSSKQGATDNAWHRIGNFATSDKREGWWCATDFELLFHPVHRISTTPGQWQTICLPYAFDIPQGMHVYELEGLVNDSQEVALGEVTETEAGVPYVYIFDAQPSTRTPQLATLYERGNKASSAKIKNGLKGYFKQTTTSKVPMGYYILTDGQWLKIGSDRPNVGDNCAYISRLAALQQLAAWSGPTLPLVDNTVGIDDLNSQPSTLNSQPSHLKSQQYNLKGEPVKASPFNNSKKKYLKVGNSVIIL